MKIVVFLISLVAACYANSQEINFKELGRAGSPVVKRYVVEGVALDGQSYLKRFEGVDTARIEARRANSSSSGSGGASGASNESAGWRFVDKVHQCADWEYCTQVAKIECLGGRKNREYATVHTGRNGGKWLVLTSSETGSSVQEVANKFCNSQ